jgi:hypothetical protein
MANSRKRISELPALNVASLDTTFVLGISGSTTYKISINNLTSSLDGAFATDLVTATLGSSLDGKVSTSSFNQYTASAINGTISGSSQLTSSYDQRYVISGSITQTTWDNIANKPAGIVSQSTDLSSLNSKTGSYATTGSNTFTGDMTLISSSNIILRGPGDDGSSGSGDIIWQDTYGNEMARLWKSADNDRLTVSFTGSHNSYVFGTLIHSLNLKEFGDEHFILTSSFNQYTASYFTDSSSFDTKITTEKNRIDAILSASNANSDTFAEVVSLINSVDLTNDNAFATFYTASNGRLTSLENTTSSFNSFTQSIDSRLDNLEAEISSSVSYAYITYITEPEVPNDDTNGFLKPDGNISGSISYNQSTGYFTLLAGKTYKLRAVVNTTGGAASFSPDWDLQWKDVTNNNFIGKQSIYSGDGEAFAIITPNTNIQVGLRSLSNTENDHPYIIKTSTFFFIEEMALGIVEGITGSTDYTQITNKPTLISGSSQLTSSFDTRYTLSGSVVSGTTPAGTISGSSQLTSSYDSRYSLSGSVLTSFSSSVDTRLDTLEASIITGSVNYVQTLGARVTGVTSTGVTIITGSITTTGNPIQIMVTGDANPVNVTSWTRLQIYRNETAIGNIVQVENSSNLNVPYCLNVIDTPSAGTYTYSMRTVSGISGLFDFGESTGPTLTAVELKTNTNLPSTNNTFTGTNTFGNTTTFASAGGDEGGEIQFGVPTTNTTLQNRVTVDVWQNRLRIFEGSANANGVYIDLSKPTTGNNNEITYKASGIVNAGTFVTLDNIKATVTTSGQRGLSLATVSGTFACNIGGNFAGAVVGASGYGGTATITTTPSTSIFGWGFTAIGDMANYIITDTTNSRAYRIIIQIGNAFNNNLVSIERLH